MRLFIFILFFLSSLNAIELNWEHDYNNAIKQAKKQNKDVYLFVGADKCRFCDRFKDMTLSKEHVIKRLQEDYVLLYMSRDKHDIPKHFEVKGVPRHYFLTNSGKIIHADRGSREVDGFFDLLEEVDLKKEN
ncbi:thioredoxin family protein [Sulfurimonas sp.]|uniref:thioredoxin family protein n=1 Tax=Sulfurimonas sp. TaxID=2022749 RepID=UPI00262E2A93|nr:thioredoxin family protein [Sulfurimonas sp.]MCW8895574.1 thioredoxin family protein [Sulfurimonas sp.]MCW9066801.1 thioredoxin family protein [Sulfurimonas sp.]